MQIEILTLFPEMFQGALNESLLKKAQDKGLFSLKLIDLRDFTSDKHKTADDTAYGGGAGMVMKVDVISAAIASRKKNSEHRAQSTPRLPSISLGTSRSGQAEHRIIYMCPTGKVLTQEKINELAKVDRLTILCGHYEGIDERARGLVDEEISSGDYVLTGGEIPAMVLIDAVVRQIPGVVKEEESVRQDSFFQGLLDYPSYTKPEDFEGKKVPAVLLSGHHAAIDIWRRKASLRLTLERRPALLAQAELKETDRKLLSEIILE